MSYNVGANVNENKGFRKPNGGDRPTCQICDKPGHLASFFFC